MNREVFIKFVERSQERLRKFLVGVCVGDKSLADDIAQEAYLKAYLSNKIPLEFDQFQPWITKIAYNTFLNHLRSKKINIGLDNVKEMESQQKTDEVFQYENLYRALDSLPLRERSVVVLYYMEGYAMKEISKILEISEDAVRQGVSRGRKRLKMIMDKSNI